MLNWKPIPMQERYGKSYVNCQKTFTPIIRLSNEDVQQSYNFAYDMASVNKHREYRTGGTHHRRKMEVFVSAFCGKLSEFAVHDYLTQQGICVEPPDLEIYERGTWDSEDLVLYQNYNEELIRCTATIKSTKSFGNLLLLEKEDWDSEATYIPSEEQYDIFILVRTNMDLEKVLKRQKMLYTDDIKESALVSAIQEAAKDGFLFDIPGYLYRSDLVKVIRARQVIRKDQMLNGRTKMDADNYYVQAGNMRDIDVLVQQLK